MQDKWIAPIVLSFLLACKKEAPPAPKPDVSKPVSASVSGVRDASVSEQRADVVEVRLAVIDSGRALTDAASADVAVMRTESNVDSATPVESDAATAADGVPRLDYSQDAGVTGPTASGFAGVSEDGNTLVATVLGTGPLSASELSVVFLDAHTGAVQRRTVLVNHEDSEAMESDVPPAMMVRLRERVAAANTALAGLHARSLPAYVEAEHDEDAGTATASGQGWHVTSAGNELSVRRGDATTPVRLRRVLPAMTGGTRECKDVNTPRLRGFHVVATDRLLVQVAYHGTDTCWEKSDVWMVVTVPTTTTP